MEEKPKRRWLRFSVRTLLVAVTIFCMWLGWQVSIVRARKTMKNWVEARGGKVMENDQMEVTYSKGMLFSTNGAYRPVPLIRRLLGDKRVAMVMLGSGAANEDVPKVKSVFPEAVAYFGDGREAPPQQTP